MSFVLLLLAIAGQQAATAGPPVPLGPEVVLDAQPSHGTCPTIAGHADGAFAITWRGATATGRGQGTVVRTAGADGVLGPPLRLAKSDMARLHGLTTAGEGYQLAWDHFSWGDDISRIETLDRSGQIISSVSFKQGPGRGRLSPQLTGYDDSSHRLSLRPTGGHAAIWTGSGVAESERGPHLLVQLLDEQGDPTSALTAWRASPTFIGVSGCGGQGAWPLHHPSNGQFIVLWDEESGEGQDAIDKGTLGRRFAADGKPLGEIVPLLPAPPAGGRNMAAGAIGADGTMAIAWAVGGGVPYDVGHVRLRTFAADGTVLGNAVVVPRWRSSGETSYPQSVAVDPDGNVLLIWSQYSHGDVKDALARVYSRQAVPRGPAFHFTSAVSGDRPSIAGATAGWAGNAWLIAWSAVAPDPGNPSGCGCRPDPVFQTYVRRFLR